MKKLLSAILILIALGSFACTTETETEPEEIIHTWDSQGIEFTYDSSYNLLGDSNTLFITISSSIMPPPGEIMMELMIITEEATLEEAISFYESYQEHTVQTVAMGENEVTIVQYVSELAPDYTYTVMLLATENSTITFVPGLGHEELAEEILTSVNFL